MAVPGTVKRSSPKARRTWKKTHDSAVEQYGEGPRAHRTADSGAGLAHLDRGDLEVARLRGR